MTVVLNVVNSTDTAPTAGWPSLQLISTDGGLTFSPPRPVAALNADPIVEGILGGPGYGIELMKHGGRLVSCGATGYHSGHAMEAAVWYSDDVGVTWNVSTTPLAQMQECQMVELANGSVVINMRAGHMDPCDCRAVSISHDGGETWSAPWYVHALIEPVCSAGFVNTGDNVSRGWPAHSIGCGLCSTAAAGPCTAIRTHRVCAVSCMLGGGVVRRPTRCTSRTPIRRTSVSS